MKLRDIVLACCITAAACGPRPYTELGPGVWTEGTVVKKEHLEKHYLNPVDNINPMSKIDLFFDYKKGRWATSTTEKHLVKVVGKEGEWTLNDKGLYDMVHEGEEVTLLLSMQYRVLKDKYGHVKEKTLLGYQLGGVQKK